ncbi:MAG: sugar ABC transporter permease [Lachnospiraceae bacterium]|nr:sugar ABC transporter permease [Lachnospiraceae bacterium]
MSNVPENAAAEPKKRGMSQKTQKTIVILVFMAVPLALLLLFTYIPFGKMIQFSFYNMKYIGKRTFVGLANYKQVFKNKELFGSLVVSLYYMGGGVVQLALSLLFATMFVFKVKGEALWKACMFFPYLICGIAIGFIFKFFYFHGYVLDTILMTLGMELEDLPLWLQNTSINNISLAATSVWRYTGQQTILFLGAMMSVDTSLYEAAVLDGCNRWQQFRYIILPSIKSIIVLNIILCVSGCLSAFEPPYVITNGSFGTATYFVKMNSVAHETQKVGLASAMAIILLVIIIAFTVGQQLFFKYVFNNGTDSESREAVRRKKKEEKAAKRLAGKGMRV